MISDQNIVVNATDTIANSPIESGLDNLHRLTFSVIYNEEQKDKSQQWWVNYGTAVKISGPVPFPNINQ